MENFPTIENPTQEKEEGTPTREQLAEKLLDFMSSEKGTELLHGQKFEELFSDEEHKRKFIRDSDPNDLTNLLNCFNGILRNKQRGDWEMDGKDVRLEGFIETHIPPFYKDKPELLEEMLLSAQKMNQENRSMEDIALLIATSINAIHPYNDGNGRTSRLLYTLLNRDFNKSTEEELKSVLGEYGRECIDADPSIIGWKIARLIREEAGINNSEINTKKLLRAFIGWGEKEFSDEINEDDKKVFLKFLEEDSSVVFVCLFKFFKNHPEDINDKYIKPIQGNKEGMTFLEVSTIMKNLNQANVEEILGIYRELKKNEVEKLMDCIVNPEKENYQIKDKGEEISFLDYFKKEIKERIRKET